ncbi:uncharacterized protein IL334_007182 [Kwoniella shivajii]|uniref:Uncharacterized protein n=1 Tax=Kwoniella shivajii TaxID=564305 RepID=A0ABZ1D8G5_9TREE|nr:hypothetical protein IL334_007182 [Kwoniella shivajii]
MASPSSSSSSYNPPSSPHSHTIPLPDPTINHLLSIPPLLNEISPSLAALHMARLRLILAIPAARNNTSHLGGWCNLCGGLRLSQGGAESNIGSGSGSGSGGGSGSEVDKLRKSDIPTFIKKQIYTNKRKLSYRNAICGTCGEKYQKPIPNRETLNSFPPSRRLRRINRKDQDWISSTKDVDVDVDIDQEKMKIQHTKSDKQDKQDQQGKQDKQDQQGKQDKQKDHLTESSEIGSNHNPDITSISHSSSGVISSIDPNTDIIMEPTPLAPPPKLLTRPSLSHIPNSSPNLPTYPQPPPTHQPSSSNLTAKKTSGGGVVKRKKKSGLAKLLAENKEREMVSQGSGGMWGLG